MKAALKKYKINASEVARRAWQREIDRIETEMKRHQAEEHRNGKSFLSI